jgi:hypothetical protein
MPRHEFDRNHRDWIRAGSDSQYASEVTKSDSLLASNATFFPVIEKQLLLV